MIQTLSLQTLSLTWKAITFFGDRHIDYELLIYGLRWMGLEKDEDLGRVYREYDDLGLGFLSDLGKFGIHLGI